MVGTTFLTFAMFFKKQIGIRVCRKRESRKPRFARGRFKNKAIKKKKSLNQKG